MRANPRAIDLAGASVEQDAELNADMITIRIPRSALLQPRVMEDKSVAEPKYMTVAQFAQLLHLHPDTVRRYIHNGMPSMQAGKGYRIHVAGAKAWLQAGGARIGASTKHERLQ